MRSASAVPAPRPEQTVVPFQKAKGRRTEEIAFLPAALEIAEAPPSPIGRAIAIALMLLVCAALAWSAWGTIDIVASATGKVVSSGRSKVVQPFETWVVSQSLTIAHSSSHSWSRNACSSAVSCGTGKASSFSHAERASASRPS